MEFLQNVIDVCKIILVFANACHACLGPWTMSTLINEPTPQQGLATSVQPSSFVTGVVSVLAGVAPQIPGTSQRPGNVLTGRVFHHHTVLGEIRKFSCLEISGVVPSGPQGEECAADF